MEFVLGGDSSTATSICNNIFLNYGKRSNRSKMKSVTKFSEYILLSPEKNVTLFFISLIVVMSHFFFTDFKYIVLKNWDITAKWRKSQVIPMKF